MYFIVTSCFLSKFKLFHFLSLRLSSLFERSNKFKNKMNESFGQLVEVFPNISQSKILEILNSSKGDLDQSISLLLDLNELEKKKFQNQQICCYFIFDKHLRMDSSHSLLRFNKEKINEIQKQKVGKYDDPNTIKGKKRKKKKNYCCFYFLISHF